MPTFVNKNDHPARVPHPSGGPLRRIVPGQVVEAEGEYADTLGSLSGFETASGDDKLRWERRQESQRVAGAMPGDGSRIASKLAIGPVRQQIRMQTIVAPLQRVVGDDAAPYAPDSGTITTKAQQAQVSPEHAQAMAAGEVNAVLGERVEGVPAATNADIVVTGDVTQDQIHNAQVENRELAEQAGQEFIGATSGEEPHAKKASSKPRRSAAASRADDDK